jgi:hypothetical protein
LRIKSKINLSRSKRIMSESNGKSKGKGGMVVIGTNKSLTAEQREMIMGLKERDATHVALINAAIDATDAGHAVGMIILPREGAMEAYSAGGPGKMMEVAMGLRAMSEKIAGEIMRQISMEMGTTPEDGLSPDGSTCPDSKQDEQEPENCDECSAQHICPREVQERRMSLKQAKHELH